MLIQGTLNIWNLRCRDTHSELANGSSEGEVGRWKLGSGRSCQGSKKSGRRGLGMRHLILNAQWKRMTRTSVPWKPKKARVFQDSEVVKTRRKMRPEKKRLCIPGLEITRALVRALHVQRWRLQSARGQGTEGAITDSSPEKLGYEGSREVGQSLQRSVKGKL